MPDCQVQRATELAEIRQSSQSTWGEAPFSGTFPEFLRLINGKSRYFGPILQTLWTSPNSPASLPKNAML
jgi:hypothetical protein